MIHKLRKNSQTNQQMKLKWSTKCLINCSKVWLRFRFFCVCMYWLFSLNGKWLNENVIFIKIVVFLIRIDDHRWRLLIKLLRNWRKNVSINYWKSNDRWMVAFKPKCFLWIKVVKKRVIELLLRYMKKCSSEFEYNDYVYTESNAKQLLT